MRAPEGCLASYDLRGSTIDDLRGCDDPEGTIPFCVRIILRRGSAAAGSKERGSDGLLVFPLPIIA